MLCCDLGPTKGFLEEVGARRMDIASSYPLVGENKA